MNTYLGPYELLNAAFDSYHTEPASMDDLFVPNGMQIGEKISRSETVGVMGNTAVNIECNVIKIDPELGNANACLDDFPPQLDLAIPKIVIATSFDWLDESDDFHVTDARTGLSEDELWKLDRSWTSYHQHLQRLAAAQPNDKLLERSAMPRSVRHEVISRYSLMIPGKLPENALSDHFSVLRAVGRVPAFDFLESGEYETDVASRIQTPEQFGRLVRWILDVKA